MARRRKFVKREVAPSFRINDRITAREIRLVGDNFDEISEVAGKKIESNVYDTRTVLRWADDMALDLVEISPKAAPPVCKIIDYKKFLFQKKKKDKEIKAKTVKTVIKEIRFGPNTDDHDFQFKLKHARKFLTDGAKVKAYVHFKGRTIVFKDRGKLLLLKFLNELSDLGGAESLPEMDKRRMFVIISPLKKQKKSN